jgi:hypothetical protein
LKTPSQDIKLIVLNHKLFEGQIMRYIILAAMTFTVVTAPACRADIITYDYSISNGTYTFDSGASPAAAAGVGPNVGPIQMALSLAPFTEVADLSISTSGGQFTVSYDFEAGLNTLTSPTAFSFSNIAVTGAALLQSFTFNPGASTVGTNIAAAPTFTAGTNAFSFTTVGTDVAPALDGVLNYVFDFTDDSIVAAVPEPSSFAMLFAGGVGVVVAGRRRRKNAA